MSWSQNFPNIFNNITTTNQVLKNTDNETKRIYSLFNQLFAANGHSHSGSGSDGSKLDINDLKSIPWVDVRGFGAVGDGITDDTTKIQAALDSIENGVIYFSIPLPALTANYIVSDTLIIKPGHKIVGVSRSGVSVTMRNDTKYAFSYLSPLQASGYDINMGLVFSSMTIKAKYAINLNQSGDYATIFSKQGHLKGVVFSHLILSGKYGSAVDANYNTAVEPTQVELDGYGIGIRAAKMFDSKIENCQIEGFGTNIRFDGCDINTIDNCRLNASARHIYIYDHDTYGHQNKIRNCDILFNCRIGGIYLDHSWYTTVDNNYFEHYQPSACFIKTVADNQTLYTGNRFDSTKRVSTAMLSFNPAMPFIFTNNKYNASDLNPPIEIKSDYVQSVLASNQSIGIWRDNAYNMPKPDYPGVLVDQPPNPYLFKYNQSQKTIGGVGATVFVWKVSPVTGRYVLQTTLSTTVIGFSIQNTQHRKFLVKCVGRKVTGSGYQNITYVESGSTIVRSTYAGFTKTDEVETVSFTLKVPDSKLAIGYWSFELVNTEVEYESIEIMPIDYELSTAAPTSGTYRVRDKVLNSAPSPGGYDSWVCTTAGQVCTTAWVASTAYVVGDVRYVNSKVYQCTVAGTSSTTAPSHTSGTATDGTVTWQYVNTLAVFKGFGIIQS
jgi:parallel beta-helix repeat protein